MPIDARAEYFAHGADIGIHGLGPTREAAFRASGSRVVSLCRRCFDASSEARTACRLRSTTRGLLLVDWLNALIYHMAVDHLLFGRFHVVNRGPSAQRSSMGRGDGPKPSSA